MSQTFGRNFVQPLPSRVPPDSLTYSFVISTRMIWSRLQFDYRLWQIIQRFIFEGKKSNELCLHVHVSSFSGTWEWVRKSTRLCIGVLTLILATTRVALTTMTTPTRVVQPWVMQAFLYISIYIRRHLWYICNTFAHVHCIWHTCTYIYYLAIWFGVKACLVMYAPGNR